MKKSFIIVIATFLVGIIAYLGYVFYFDGANSSNKYSTIKVSKGDIEDVVTATGTLQPRDYVDVGAQVSGQLQDILVEVGDIVKKGDLLAKINPTLLESKVEASNAQLKLQEAQLLDKIAQLEYATINYNRQKQLYNKDATSLENYQSAELSLKSATAQLDMLKAQIEQTKSNIKTDETNLEYTNIYAPMDGTIMSISARAGQTLNANQQAPIILKIADLSIMSINTEVSEAEIVRLKPKMDVYFKTLGSQKKWYTKVLKIEPTPTITNNVVLYNAIFEVDNSSNELMTNMTAQVFFVVNQAKDVMTLPLSYINTLPNGDNVVTVLKNKSTIEEKKIEIGVSNRISVEVVSGLSFDDEIVLPNNKTDKKSQQASGPRFQARI
ncbi:MAG: efflux RND transporter periplasmic adaptor subunit [Arcobacter butzleri]|jgi:macrolide-specific efflux system membrane fusion protein|nr:efflux RND transporter periplasmic adaptor subunit [Arcobacteraceae bacterium]NLO16610.1 efflux RND transporter periplasmic adaptor subunit [Aliarcobacter butzleri]